MRQPWLLVITLLIVGACMACAGFAYLRIQWNMSSTLWVKDLRRQAVVVVSALALVTACAPTRQYAVLDVQATKLNIVDVGQSPKWLLADVGSGVEVVLTSAESDSLGDPRETTLFSQMNGSRRALEWSGIDHCPGRVLYSSFKRFDSTGTYLLGYCHHASSTDDQRFLIFQPATPEGNGSQGIPVALPLAETVNFTAHVSSERFMMGFGSLLNGLYWWSPTDGAEPVEGVVKTSTGEFELADAFTHLSQDGFARTGNAKSPDWSPDGSRIAFFASNVPGLEGQDRLGQPWDLCLLDVSADSIVCPL